MTLREYIQVNKNVTFNEMPFNEVDNLLLSELSYIDFELFMPFFANEKISLKMLATLFFNRYTPKDIKKLRTAPSIQKIISYFKLMASSKRYQDILIYHYVNEVEERTQFGAMSMLLGDGTIYIAFEGTDDSIYGWKEDFKLSYQFPVVAQQKAAEYLDKTISFFGPKVRIGGHSKGGNLAMAGYMLCDFWTRRKIIEIYNNDGPGFRKKEYESKMYRRMLRKLRMFVPEESIVGMLLRHPKDYTVIKSSYRGVLQHDGVSWLVGKNKFLRGKLSPKSKKFERRFIRWIYRYDDEKRKKIVLALFSIFERAGVKGLSELKITKVNKLIALVKENRHMDKETRKLLVDSFKDLLLMKDNDNVDV